MKHHHSHIALLMIALSITVFVCALYGYMQYAIGSSLDRALAAREAVKNEQVYNNQKQNLNALYNDTASDRAKLGLFFVADDQKVAFIEKIESLNVSTGAQITLSNIVADDLATSPVGTLGKVSLRVDAVGSWSSIMRVLRLVETLPYKTTVSGVRLDMIAGDAKSQRTEWRITFALESISIRRSQ